MQQDQQIIHDEEQMLKIKHQARESIMRMSKVGQPGSDPYTNTVDAARGSSNLLFPEQRWDVRVQHHKLQIQMKARNSDE